MLNPGPRAIPPPIHFHSGWVAFLRLRVVESVRTLHTMSSKTQLLGVCPECDADIPPGAVLVEYERNGQRVAYAECPDCVEPVHPK